MLKEILDARKLPALKSREEMLDVLMHEEYGYLPPLPEKVEFVEKKNSINNFCAGKAKLSDIDITVTLYGEKFTFPAQLTMPTKKGKHPFFVSINFTFDDDMPNRYLPSEEIVDNGYAIISFRCEDVTSDDENFDDGLAGVITRNTAHTSTSCGKLAMWAWAAQRLMDYAETREELDLTRAIVCGHSRLGKTALLCAATDTRFACGYSNDSGCSGAAITRNKVGETAEDIYRVFPYWFCDNYKKYSNNEDSMPFDQHWLIASIAPRLAYVASASEDEWADPDSEFLGCVAASGAYESLGMPGFVCEDRLPKIGDAFHEGNIGYHLRAGRHYFSREDWNILMKFFERKCK